MKKIIILQLFLFLAFNSFAQLNVQHVEPPNWWVGMKSTSLQIMIHGENIAFVDAKIRDKDVLLKSVKRGDSPNYIFLDVEIAPDAKPGSFKIRFFDGGKNIGSHEYQLLQRAEGSALREGFSQKDAIYLLMPDRFSNGNPANDNLPEMHEKVNRADHDGRHGGDLQGVMNHLDYIKETGFTALWMNPVFENNQEKYSYHGYSITDFYKVDARFGSNEDFKNLVTACHQKEIKVIKDMIFNHIGSNHWWMDDLPFKDWVHQFPEYTQSNYRASVVVDPYVSKHDKTKMLTGWFDRTMPDLNQNNPYLANYLIQNSIWWIEYAGIDGIRMDTQPYPYKEMMSDWAARVLMEYPDFRILGEIWVGNPAIVSYWKSKKSTDGYESNLNSVFDFPLHDALKMGFNENEGWDSGLSRLYNVLTQDYLYEKPEEHVVFCDNHDVSRIAAVLNNDPAKIKQVLLFIFTIRGIPLVYYGTEIGMSGKPDDHHGKIRRDFPGGWANDSVNAFSQAGRDSLQNALHQFTQRMLNIRSANEVLQTGKLIHFIPNDGVYVYFRYNNDEAVMVVINNNKQERKLDRKVYAEMLDEYLQMYDLESGKEQNYEQDLVVEGNGYLLISLKK